MRVLTAASAAALDRIAEERYRMPRLLLMENAGRAVAEEVKKSLCPRRKKRVAVFCGKGNNGADGLVAARHLLCAGIQADIFLAGFSRCSQPEAQVNLAIARRLGGRIRNISAVEPKRLIRTLRAYGCIVDALLGVGLRRGVSGLLADLIRAINAAGVNTIAVDIPSGLDATTGEARGACVEADSTVTFVAWKKGMASAAGKRLCGKVIVSTLGIPL